MRCKDGYDARISHSFKPHLHRRAKVFWEMIHGMHCIKKYRSSWQARCPVPLIGKMPVSDKITAVSSFLIDLTSKQVML